LSTGAGYTALHETVAAWADPDRVLLRVEGARAASILNGLASADIQSLPVGGATLSFVLSSKGRPIAVPRVLRLEDSVLLDVSLEAVEGLLDHFSVYLPPRFARVTVVEGTSRVSLIGPLWQSAAATLGLPRDDVSPSAGSDRAEPARIREVPALATGAFPTLAVERHPEAGAGMDAYVWPDSVERADEVIQDAVRGQGGSDATPAEYETWRIECGIPRFGRDISADNLPQETGLVESAVSFDKGCYTGQEVVARIHYRGHVNRQLRGLRAVEPDRSDPLVAGSELYREGRTVGHVTSACHSPRLGPIALAYVRRESEPGVRLGTDPTSKDEWIVSELPFTFP
jgi:folate-binding protein YgfZ